MGRQERASLQLQRENFLDQLKLDIYRDLNEKITELSHAEIKASGYAIGVHMSMRAYQTMAGLNVAGPPNPIDKRAMEFSDLHFATSRLFSRILGAFESYEIVHPELHIFKTALNVAWHNVGLAQCRLGP